MNNLTLSQEIVRLVIASGAIMVLTLIGGFLPLAHAWNRTTIRVLLAFGIGILLGAAFLHMIPASVEHLGRNIGIPVLAGFLLIVLLERFMMIHACEEEGCSFHHMGLAAFIGISVHALIDGFALGSGLAIPEVSLAVAAAIVLHKLPAALSLSAILLHCEYPRRRVFWMIAGFSFATPLGAALAYGALRELSGDAIHYAIAFSAGTFLAIATADLLPQIHSVAQGRWRNLAALAVGIALMAISGTYGGHSH